MADDFKYDVFLSHSSKDKDIVRAVAERLRADGLCVWFDEWEINPGDSVPKKIDDGLEDSRVLVLCMSANAFGSDWTQLESYTFRFRDPLNKERRFIPLRLDEAEIKGSLAQFLYINWLPEEREQSYAKLLEACRPPAKLTMAGTQAAMVASESINTSVVYSANANNSETMNILYPYMCASTKHQDDSLLAGYVQATADDLLTACNQMIQCLAGFDTVFLMSPEVTAEQVGQFDNEWFSGFSHTHEILCLAATARKIDLEPYKQLAISAYTFWKGVTAPEGTEADLKRLFSPGIEALYKLKRALMLEIADTRSA